MKKLGFFLLVLMLLGSTASFGESNSDTGIWERRAYMDEFDLPMDQYYVSNAEPIVGKFSNSATTNSQMYAWLYVDYDDIVKIKLVEYSSTVVRNDYPENIVYNTVIMDANGEKFYISGYMPSGSDTIIYEYEYSNIIVETLNSDGIVRFSIIEETPSTSRYIFSIKDASGLNEAVTNLLLHRVNSYGLREGASVIHKEYGIGKISSIAIMYYQGHYTTVVNILFEDGEERPFDFPLVVTSGSLSL